MKQDISQRLAKAREDVRHKAKLAAKIQSVKVQLQKARREQSKWAEQLAKERKDVTSLEGLSFTGLFHSLLGTREQRLAIEQQEYVAAKLKYDSASEVAEQLLQELSQLQDEIALLADAEQQYEQLLSDKESYLSATQSQVARELVELGQRLAELNADHRELSEAIQAGERALSYLETIRDSLSSATNWGMADMLGGGMFSTMAKHSAMDRAKVQAQQAQRAILKFEQELADTGQQLQATLEVDGFSKFADLFFDGLITDWIMQSKIKRASEACDATIVKVRIAVRSCESRLATVRREQAALGEDRVRLIEATEPYE